ncbi:FG-GAP repeat [Seminavis robusta]|uniref:FG-GAP repeat n=1 Tax=Seminavis robusta TaxID=568900 RepID=A0A9N8HEA6_9STRA|nr:FG-GAP repeat [Seminavis robusta]|eukprot:Sro379_g130410.1 FG-GAP repeat (835) ;mRNA; r:20127-22709
MIRLSLVLCCSLCLVLLHVVPVQATPEQSSSSSSDKSEAMKVMTYITELEHQKGKLVDPVNVVQVLDNSSPESQLSSSNHRRRRTETLLSQSRSSRSSSSSTGLRGTNAGTGNRPPSRFDVIYGTAASSPAAQQETTSTATSTSSREETSSSSSSKGQQRDLQNEIILQDDSELMEVNYTHSASQFHETHPGYIPPHTNATVPGQLDRARIKELLPDDAIGPFRIRMEWHEESCWQGDCEYELDWCMQCEGYECNEGDILWIELCRNIDQQLFVWIPAQDEADFTPEQDEEPEGAPFDDDKKKKRLLQQNLLQHINIHVLGGAVSSRVNQQNIDSDQQQPETISLPTMTPTSSPTNATSSPTADLDDTTTNTNTTTDMGLSVANMTAFQVVVEDLDETNPHHDFNQHHPVLEGKDVEIITDNPSQYPSTSPTVTPSNQPSLRPSITPALSPSIQPSNQPTSSPSVAASLPPSIQPSKQPTSSPSVIPTNQPTTGPSQYPSSSPTTTPSNAPSWSPTETASLPPSEVPLTMAPTDSPSKSLSSTILSHAPSESPTEMPTSSVTETIELTDIPTGGPTAHGFDWSTAPTSNNPTETPTTQQLQEDVDNFAFEFPTDPPTLSPASTHLGVFKVADLSKNLCLDRVHLNRYNLRTCDQSVSQLFYGVPHKEHLHHSFELRPRQKYAIDRIDARCVNMHHHPRNYEEIINTSCELARHYHTSRWGIVLDDNNNDDDTNGKNFAHNQNKNINTFLMGFDESPLELTGNPNLYTLLEPRRNPRCSIYTQCGVCQGHCQSDDDCVGSLKCFERSWPNPIEAPPGCQGEGVPRIDYCYAVPGN